MSRPILLHAGLSSMRAVRVLSWLALSIAFAFGLICAGTAEPITPQLTPLEADVLTAPHAFKGSDQRKHLVYEVRIANVTGGRVSLKRITVMDAQAGTAVASLGAEAIGGRLSLGGRRGSESNELGPFQFGVIFMHVVLEPGAAVPAALVHAIEASFEKPGTALSMRAAQTPVITGVVPVLGPPLRGHGYVAADGCCDSIRHVRALLTLDGRFYLSQRFAVDWERIDDGGRLLVGDPKQPRSYHIYGDTVLSVADGIVTTSRNDLPDQVPGKLPDGLPIDEADGNFAILDIGHGNYALYAHMQPGSVRVRAGDRVRRGDQIGIVGNSGNSQAPHLHFQLMDAPSPLTSNGIPYAFDAFSVTAVDEAGTADFDRAEATGSPLTLTPRVPPMPAEKVMPLDLVVVDWRN